MTTPRSERQQRQERRADEHRRGQESELVFGPSLAGVKEQLARITTADRRLGENLPPVLIEGETGTGSATVRPPRLPLEGAELIAAIILASIFGLVVFILFGLLSKAAIGKWHTTTRGR